MQLAIETNDVMHDCEGLGQLVGLRALHITECGRLRDVAALSSLADLRTLHLTSCKLRATSSLAAMSRLRSLNLAGNHFGEGGAASLAPSLAPMAQLTSLNLGKNSIGEAGAASLAPSLALMAQLTSIKLA